MTNNEQKQRLFNWLHTMGLIETKRYFSPYGILFGIKMEWWEKEPTTPEE